MRLVESFEGTRGTGFFKVCCDHDLEGIVGKWKFGRYFFDPKLTSDTSSAEIDMKNCPFCAEQIQDAAVVCKHCGRELAETKSVKEPPTSNTKSQQVSPGAAILAVLLALGGIAWMSGAFSMTDSSGRMVLPQSVAAPAPVVTKAEFDQLQEGMTYEQAVAIIGASGELQSSSDVVEIKTVMYSWMNSNGSNMNAMFQNNKLVTKAQFGLP